MKNAMLFVFLIGTFASSDGLIFPLLFPISIRLTFHHRPLPQPEPVYHFQTIPVYKEVVKKDPSHDKVKHSYGDGYKGSSYGDGYGKTYSNEPHVKEHDYGSTYGTETPKGNSYQAPVSYHGHTYIKIGKAYPGESPSAKSTGYGNDLSNGKGASYDLSNVKGTSYSSGTTYGGDVPSVKGPSYNSGATYSGDVPSVKGTGYNSGTTYGGDLPNVKGTSYNSGTTYGGDVPSVKDTSYGTSYGEVSHNQGAGYLTTYDDSSKSTDHPAHHGGSPAVAYPTSYTDDSRQKGEGYVIAYDDDPPNSKPVTYTSYGDQSGVKGAPYTNGYSGPAIVKDAGYSSPYGPPHVDKVKPYGHAYEGPNAYSSHEYPPTYTEEGTYVVQHPHSTYEERSSNDLQFYAGFGSSIYGDSYAKIVYVPKAHIKVSLSAYKR